jgi:hypothetical protein
MRKVLLTVALGLGLLLGGTPLPEAHAQKGRGSFSSGRSSSSGRGSFSSGRGSSSSKPSSSNRSISGKGSVSPPSPQRPSKPSKPSSPAFSPSGNKPAAPKPKTGFDAGAGAAQRKAESQKTFERTKPAAPKTPTPLPKTGGSLAGKPATPSAPAPEKRFGSGSPTGRPATPGPKGGFDAAAGKAQRQAESKAAYTKGEQPKATYTTPKGETRPVDTNDRRVDSLRRQLDHERWVNRDLRRRTFYEPYWSRPVVTYHDPYSSFFWWWLLAQSLDTRAHWAYHHRHTMDDARYRDMVGRDAQLEARIRQLEAEKVQRDTAYKPPEMSDPDLMFTDEYVDAVYNPQPPPAPPPGTEPEEPTAESGEGEWTAGLGEPAAPAESRGWWPVFRTLLIIGAVLGVLVWLVFFKRWGGD